MADLVNPYANPYLPSFVNQRPVVNGQPPVSVQPPMANYSQIHSVKGFEGADAYCSKLANGASEIVAEEDPNLARIYILAKDSNGQMFVQAHDMSAPVERPNPITMDDLSVKMNQILDRLNKLEGEKGNGDQSVRSSSWKDAKQSGGAGAQPGSRNGSGGSGSTGSIKPGTDEQSTDLRSS